MRSGLATAAALAAITACSSTSYPYRPPARAFEESYAQCRIVTPSTDANARGCFTAAQWLAFQGREAEALALHQRVCRMGEVRSCHVAVDGLRDAGAAWQICTDRRYGVLRRCELGLSAVPPGDPRRVEAMRPYCERSDRDCVQLLGWALADDLAGWQRASDLCTAAATDDATCAALAATPSVIGTAAAALLRHRRCEPTIGAMCTAAAHRFRDTEPSQVAARSELLARGCQLGSTEACTEAAELGTWQQARDRCAAGEVPACRELGAIIVRRAAVEGRPAGW